MPDALVTIGLPVRNAGADVAKVISSVLAQDHENIELVVSDNASTDDTEEICRDLAATDSRIRYLRQDTNIGLLPNFVAVMHEGRGEFIRWIGNDDQLEPNYVSRLLAEFAAAPDLLLVTSQIAYTDEAGGPPQTARYEGSGLGSADPAERFKEMLRLLNQSHLLIDPLYGLMRRPPILSIRRPLMLREDEIFAARLALAGRWAHVNEVLAHRVRKRDRLADVATKLDVPAWQSHFANTLEGRELLRAIDECDLTSAQRAAARSTVRHWFVGRERLLVMHRSRKLVRLATGRARNRARSAS